MAEVGAGYEYQWEVAACCVLRVLDGQRVSLGPLDEHIKWVGEITAVVFESDHHPKPTAEAFEDLTIVGSSGRTLHLQIKKDENNSKWRATRQEVKDFVRRAEAADGERRFLFVSNIGATVDLHQRHRDGIYFINFLSLTRLDPDTGHVVDGVVVHGRQHLARIGHDEPSRGFEALVAKVKRWSIDGSRLPLEVLRERTLECLGLDLADGRGGGVRNLVRFLSRPVASPDRGPSWEALAKEVWPDDPLVAVCEAHLAREPRVCVLVGPPASGKTVMARLVAKRAHDAGAMPVFWDFRESPVMPCNPAKYASRSGASARLHARDGFLLLENAHDRLDAVRLVLASHGDQPDLPLLITSRERIKEVQPELHVNLTDALAKRAEHVFLWKLRDLPATERQRVARSADWSSYFGDLWAISNALEAYDWESHRLPPWPLADALRGRLEAACNETEGLGAFLFVLAGLGQYDIAADLAALARMLPADDVCQLTSTAQRLGFVSVGDSFVRFWHPSLAQHYWHTFQLFPEQLRVPELVARFCTS